ncbi:hypothetical protein FZ983_31660 [Azospirillum sp. B21]|uniref:hypothetical protein n=1 Tax=unclassified Azospirillum TaxID=2630922 RepID=UPI0011EF020C|nr:MULTISPECIES: hypothetical protein [unclassified Azospirillum]KAA0572504.1 hypothetical protein FZ983_31660 [Azospirillum sp. B21]MDR6775611.1 hypothetical protein [Azospirillum sp. BE72]
MQVVRRILSVVFILVFALGTTALAAQVPMRGTMGSPVATLGMGVASSPACPDCGDNDQGMMTMAACHGGVCVIPSMLPPEAPHPPSMPVASPVPHDPALGWGETPHPEPYPPKSTLRI